MIYLFNVRLTFQCKTKMEAGVEGNVLNSEEAAEDDDTWLYGSHGMLYVKHP